MPMLQYRIFLRQPTYPTHLAPFWQPEAAQYLFISMFTSHQLPALSSGSWFHVPSYGQGTEFPIHIEKQLLIIYCNPSFTQEI
jgi:hypothetical protein